MNFSIQLHPGQAQSLLESLQKAGAKEASQLEDRIQLVRHAATLAFSKIGRIERSDLDKHLLALKNASVNLPFRLRNSLLERQACDVLADLCDAVEQKGYNSKIVSQKIERFTGVVAVWMPPNPECCDMELRATDVWSEAAEEARLALGTGRITQEEHDSEIKQSGQAGRGKRQV